ncbi:hypothetical protein T4D_16530 [Trichinella pseudospiralis]|uniref:Uncharacterized protein n=1 Tax=Trichinella pseudospiralis TaxID=6337 RepID=A0A0V1DWT3_TRIPS|nr:hypothetical protein T4D_16530 [Trichinella pseudospiralis]
MRIIQNNLVETELPCNMLVILLCNFRAPQTQTISCTYDRIILQIS